MEFGEKLKLLREKSKLTKKNISEIIAVPYSTYNNWETHVSMPQIPELCKLADYYGVSLDYLMRHDAEKTPETQILVNKYNRLTSDERRAVNIMIDTFNTIRIEKQSSAPSTPLTRSIPLFSQPASAGVGVYLDNADYEMIDILNIPEYSTADMAVRVNGDSMTPDYNDGDIVLVCQQPSVDIGEIGIFVYNGEGYIKRLAKDGLVSSNPLYKTIKVNELGSFKTIGKVICAV